MLAPTISFAVLAGCAPPGPPNLVVGRVAFERTDIGTGDSAFAQCTAGIGRQFNGVDLDGNGFSVRVLRTDTKQPAVVLTRVATNKTIELTAATCSVLDVYLYRGRGEVERLQPGERLLHEEGLYFQGLALGEYFISGSALFDCTAPGGGRARGSVSFRCSR